VLVEHARNLCGIADATHAEYGDEGTAIVTPLACSLNGTTIDISITPGSRLESIYGSSSAREQTTCNYGLEPAHAPLADAYGMRVAAVDHTGEVRAIERTDHPFFVGTLYQAQLTSEPGAPHPIWRAFVEMAAGA